MDTKDHSSRTIEKNQSNDRPMKEVVSDINFFIKDKNFISITKKTKRLVSAFYLLTDLLPDQEPLKWSLRKCSLDIVPYFLEIKSNSYGKRLSLDIPNPHILKLHSFLETAYMSGLVSNMNFFLLQKEIFNLIDMEIEYLKIDNQKDKNLDEDYFVENYKGHFLEKINLQSGLHQDLVVDKSAGVVQKKTYKKQTSSSNANGFKKSVIHESNNVSNFIENTIEKKEKKNERQIKIIDLIKNKTTVSIKDISLNIKGCSEKTIQRELLAMVYSGVLKKEGERRWSKYSLNL